MMMTEINRDHSFLPDDSIMESKKKFSIPGGVARYENLPMSSKMKKRIINVKRKIGMINSPSIEGNIDLNTIGNQTFSNMNEPQIMSPTPMLLKDNYEQRKSFKWKTKQDNLRYENDPSQNSQIKHLLKLRPPTG